MTSHKNYCILFVDDEIEYPKGLSFILKARGYDVLTSSSATEAIKLFSENDVDLVVSDLKMPEMDGLELIRRIKQIDPDISVMLMTAFGTIETAVQAMKDGSVGYFIKGSDPEALIADIDKLYKIKELERSNKILQHKNPGDKVFLSTKNKQFMEVLETCRKVADTDINVLILGESGVGKEVIANYIHHLSSRKDKHFIPVNCQAFSEGMIESELFGHEKGAFTGAIEKRIGRFEEANKGTLFLDEIGDLTLGTQSKLLRALESRTIERVGSNKRISLDIRLISATNKNLYSEIEEGKFRDDLLYRINTVEIVIPPIRERKEDLLDFIEFFIDVIQKEQKKQITQIDDDTLEYLLNYNYPGNIRELKNIIERLVALSDDGILKGTSIGMSSRAHQSGTYSPQLDTVDSLKEARAAFEKQHIENVLRKNNGDVTLTAERLNITKRQLWNKIADYHIDYKK